MTTPLQMLQSAARSICADNVVTQPDTSNYYIITTPQSWQQATINCLADTFPRAIFAKKFANEIECIF